jgi:hypothetical protein
MHAVPENLGLYRELLLGYRVEQLFDPPVYSTASVSSKVSVGTQLVSFRMRIGEAGNTNKAISPRFAINIESKEVRSLLFLPIVETTRLVDVSERKIVIDPARRPASSTDDKGIAAEEPAKKKNERLSNRTRGL